MGRSNMNSLKVVLPLALLICLLLLCSSVSGKPSPKHFIVQTKDNDEKNNDYAGMVMDSFKQLVRFQKILELNIALDKMLLLVEIEQKSICPIGRGRGWGLTGTHLQGN